MARRLSRLHARLVLGGVAIASLVAGVIVGCGIDDVGSLDLGTDASNDTRPVLPPGNDGRAITDGGVTADADADAEPPLACADSQCTADGGRCEDGGNDCIIECDGGATCTSTIICPPGVGCRVLCPVDDTCAQNVDCTQATSCDVLCTGKKTCADIACAGKACNVNCKGMDSCSGVIGCAATDACTIGCDGGGKNNCKAAVTCKSATCNVTCDTEACPGGVTATTTGDASIVCGNNACSPGGAICSTPATCALTCKSGTCDDKMCCDAGTCVVDGGPNCPP